MRARLSQQECSPAAISSLLFTLPTSCLVLSMFMHHDCLKLSERLTLAQLLWLQAQPSTLAMKVTQQKARLRQQPRYLDGHPSTGCWASSVGRAASRKMLHC